MARGRSAKGGPDAVEVRSRLAGLLKLASHPGRILMLVTIADAPGSVAELSSALRLSRSVASNHLSLLRMQGMVEPRRDGQKKYYALTVKGAAFVDTVRRIGS